MVEGNGNGHFATRNTAFAAYLRIEGYNLIDVEPGNKNVPAIFYFQNHPQIPTLEHEWQLGHLQGNIVKYWESYRLCLRMVRVGKM